MPQMNKGGKYIFDGEIPLFLSSGYANITSYLSKKCREILSEKQ